MLNHVVALKWTICFLDIADNIQDIEWAVVLGTVGIQIRANEQFVCYDVLWRSERKSFSSINGEHSVRTQSCETFRSTRSEVSERTANEQSAFPVSEYLERTELEQLRDLNIEHILGPFGNLTSCELKSLICCEPIYTRLIWTEIEVFGVVEDTRTVIWFYMNWVVIIQLESIQLNEHWIRSLLWAKPLGWAN